jgi:hypothetical protein
VQDLRSESVLWGGLSAELERYGRLMFQDDPIAFNISVVGPQQKLNPIASDEVFR